MDKIKIEIIIGSTRQGRFGERPANWLYEELKKRGDVDVELVDLRDYPLPFFDSPMSPSRMNREYPDPSVKRWGQKIDEADAFIILSPEYNHSYSGVLKNAMDSIFPEWNNKPVAFVGYGTVGGARAIEHLRAVAIELRMMPIKKSIHIPWEMIMKAGEGASNADMFAPLRSGMGVDHLAVLTEELLAIAKTMKAMRQAK